MNRFDYVKYDKIATTKQADLKNAFQELERLVNLALENGRAKSLVITKLEEAYMWCGKSIRDEQASTRGAELQESRSNE